MRISLAFLLIFFVCCKQKTSTGQKASNSDIVHFYQIEQFISSQVADVNKTPYYIYQKSEINGKEDSTQINTRQFGQLAQHFINPNISEEPLKKEYIETVFFDQNTKTYTLNYSTKNKELEVQNIDVLLKEDATTLKRIFIRKFFNYNSDSSAIEQLSWRPNEQFTISRVVQIPGQKEKTYQSTIVWNENNGNK